MKKKLWIIIAISVAAVALLIGIVLWFVLQPADIDLPITNTDQINYNNYTNSHGGTMNLDYRQGQFAASESYWVADKLTIWDDSGRATVLWNCGTNFQLLNDTVIYQIDDELFLLDDHKESVSIASNVCSYMTHKSRIVYSCDADSGMLEKLYWYDWDTQKSTLIHDSVQGYCIAEDKLVIYDRDGWFIMYSQGECVKNAQAQLNWDPYSFQLLGNDVVYVKDDNELAFLDLYTGNERSVVIYESCDFAKMSFICDDKNIFVSLQAVKYNGSTVSDVSTEGNGVWSINPETLAKKKICDQTFGQLYLFNGDVLLGIDEYNDVYRISIKDGKVSKLMN